MTTFEMPLGLSIHTIRKMKEMTQSELARKAGVSRNYISAIEDNRGNVTLNTLQKIVDALGYTLEIRLLEKFYPADRGWVIQQPEPENEGSTDKAAEE